jgi:dephospho-CoA kinase
MKIIGLTGGIGSGKSTVSKILEDLGAGILDADKIGHEVLLPGTEAYKQVIKEFGRDILSPDGKINRVRLGERVFASKEARERLQNIMYPEIDKILLSRLDDYRRQGKKVAVLEAAVMLESGKHWQVDEIWVTIAPESATLERLKSRPGLSQDEARRRIKSQMSNEERITKANVVIDTDCTLEELRTRVTELWQKLVDKKKTEK